MNSFEAIFLNLTYPLVYQMRKCISVLEMKNYIWADAPQEKEMNILHVEIISCGKSQDRISAGYNPEDQYTGWQQ